MHFTIATVLYQLLLKLEKAYVIETNILEYSEMPAWKKKLLHLFCKDLNIRVQCSLKHYCN